MSNVCKQEENDKSAKWLEKSKTKTKLAFQAIETDIVDDGDMYD